MKYQIRNRVINADQIKQVLYIPEDEAVQEKSGCFIDLGDAAENGWSVVLSGMDADRFWESYSGDAFVVVNP